MAAKVSSVRIVSEATRTARVVVPDYQLSLAIGKEGQNARLAARLTGWRIDIHPDTEEEYDDEGSSESAGSPESAGSTASAPSALSPEAADDEA